GRGGRRRAAGRRARLGAPLLELLERRAVHLASMAALEVAEDAVGGHEVDQARGARVADREAPLQQRRRPALRLDDELRGLLVELVLRGRVLALRGRALLDQLARELGRAVLLEELDHRLDLLVGHRAALPAREDAT